MKTDKWTNEQYFIKLIILQKPEEKRNISEKKIGHTYIVKTCLQRCFSYESVSNRRRNKNFKFGEELLSNPLKKQQIITSI